MIKALAIMGGGAVGALMRYAVVGWVHRAGNLTFPWGTFVVNVVGCLLIGVLGAVLSGPILLREEYRMAVLVGLLGAFTTFSTFGWESFMLMNDGKFGLAAANVVLSNAVGLVAVWFGYRVAQRIWGV